MTMDDVMMTIDDEMARDKVEDVRVMSDEELDNVSGGTMSDEAFAWRGANPVLKSW